MKLVFGGTKFHILLPFVQKVYHFCFISGFIKANDFIKNFNAGAMENKGLNIFNSKYVLADPKTATDEDFMNIQGVIAHEYFHNWTGNRVTLNSWFQLSLKEGLTVFLDQEFSSDLNYRSVKQISNVKNLKAFQFPEDAGPSPTLSGLNPTLKWIIFIP